MQSLNILAAAPVDIWLAVAVLAQAILAICLILHWSASRKARRLAFPSATVFLSLGAFTLLGVYAAVRREWVLAAGQVMCVAFAIGLLKWTTLAPPTSSSSSPRPRFEDEGSRLPVVAPDSAERKLPPPFGKGPG